MNASTVGRVATALLTLMPALASGSVPLAHCRNGDKAESGLQGQTTAAEIASGAVTKGFNCNSDMVGQYQGEGASWQLTAWKNCAYFDQRLNTAEAHRGTVVVDVSDPAHPKATTWLTEPAMLDPWESLKVNPARQLLAGGQRPDATQNFPGTGFSIYDISADCKNPVLKSSIVIPGSFGHSGQWAPDGKTYYITPLRPDISIEAIDTADASNPKPLPCGAATAGCANGFFTATSDMPLSQWHDLEFSKDGNTAYLTMFGSNFGTPSTASKNGLLILDVSDFQQRKPNPAYRKISSLTWDDGSVGAQNALPITIKGKPYVLFSDEGGPGTCAGGRSAAGFPRLIDVSDPKNPKTVAKLQLDVHDPSFCADALAAPIAPSGNFFGTFFNHSCHYCNVDDVDNATIAACSCFAAGLRFFDITNVNAVKEIAYFKAPAQGTKALPGSQYANSVPATFARNYDMTTSKPSFPKDRGMTSGEVWTTAHDNGLLIVKVDSNATASGGGGCASADASMGGLLVLALAHLWRRRRRLT
jgi:MYXO-CTERM domain-containing protein